MQYTKLEKISLRTHQDFSERWVQDRIADDPTILGLGDVILKDKERLHPKAGRLDLLLQDAESTRRYEVEVQLGRTDESHIIRTIEYWDIERRRYPQYDHTAVIVAEEITSRFLNVISLFNGNIPLIALQMTLIKMGDNLSLLFTKVLDHVKLGLVDEDEDVQEVTDRSYWETRGTKQTVAMADEVLELIRQFVPDLELKYNKFYIGLAKNGRPNNFVVLRPNKSHMRFEPRISQSEEVEQMIEAVGIDLMEYDGRWERYRLRFQKGDVKKHADLIRELARRAYVETGGEGV